jgi:hypothetical protein
MLPDTAYSESTVMVLRNYAPTITIRTKWREQCQDILMSFTQSSRLFWQPHPPSTFVSQVIPGAQLIYKPCSMAASKPSRRTRQFAVLQPRTLNVSQSVIKKRWTKLPETSQLRIKQLFQSIERSVQHRDGGAAVDVQSVVDNVASMFVILQ